jgi:hypothetical protein
LDDDDGSVVVDEISPPYLRLKGKRGGRLMRRLLIVANQTLGGEHLQRKVTDCMAAGPCRFYLLVPAAPYNGHGLVWTEGQNRALANDRLYEALERLRDMGADVEGEVGDQRPLDAIADVLQHRDFDEIILSTLPPGVSRWLAQDLPRRVRRTFPLPVTHVVAQPTAAAP